MSVAQSPLVRPKRWDTPFGSEMTELDVERLLGVAPFRSIDPSKFSATLPLAGILLNDARIVSFEPGDLVIREGDYGNSAFMLLHGALRVALESLAPELTGHPAPPRKSWVKAFSQLLKSQQAVERCSSDTLGNGGPVGMRGTGRDTHVFLQDVPRVLDETRTAPLSAGEFFGELAALSRSPRTASVFAETAAVVLEIRWQGLRDIMRRSSALKQHIDQLYRTNSLRVHLRQTSLLARLDTQQLEQVAAAVRFQSYGDFDWHADFSKTQSLTPLEQIAREPLIVEEGSVVDSVLLVRSGFVRVSQRLGTGHRTLAYLGKGQFVGASELIAMVDGEQAVHTCSLRAVGHVDLLEVPATVVRDLVLPTLTEEHRKELLASATIAKLSKTSDTPTTIRHNDHSTPLIDFLVDQRLINGQQAMVIDLNRCTRCDDCVRACAATHDGNPRFTREGPQFDRFQFAGACMHCADPVCMIGCPTGAIHRDTATGVVRINNQTCIGCSTCANSCPYDNIKMVELHDSFGARAIDMSQGLPIVKATKCDLCSESITGPACVAACAHDALGRIDLANLPTTTRWMNR